MKRSIERILTTHVGRLQRPDEITAALESHTQQTDPKFAARLHDAVADIVRQQRDAGVDIVCDGEFGKLTWNTYLYSRLGGHEPVAVKPGEGAAPNSKDREEFAEFYAELERTGSTYYKSPGRDVPRGTRWACTGPVEYIGQEALRHDLDNLKSAAQSANVVEAFVPATSPIRLHVNQYYKTEDEYCEAVGEAMRTEYRAIVDAGFVLQIDDPGLWGSHAPAESATQYRKIAERYVAIVNHALRGIPEDRVRYHICWGSWHGPHVYDTPMRDVVDLLLKIHAQGYAFEAANARHEHEWQIWKDVKLPDGKLLIPGIVAHATNVVEHPELVAWRIKNFASVVGRENIVAGTDCGLGYRVHPQIAWAKLKALAEGAKLASAELW